MKLITSIVFTLASATAMQNVAVAAGTGTITFNGELTANTCNADVDGQGPDATIVLPTIGR